MKNIDVWWKIEMQIVRRSDAKASKLGAALVRNFRSFKMNVVGSRFITIYICESRSKGNPDFIKRHYLLTESFAAPNCVHGNLKFEKSLKILENLFLK